MERLFTNDDLYAYEVPRYVSYDLDELAERVGRARGDWEFGTGALTGNTGAEEYANDVFALRSYCWCEGTLEGHNEDCLPNFEHFASGLKIRWYKHAHRGVTANGELMRSVWRQVIEECLDSIGFSEEDVKAAVNAETARCSSCGKTRAELTAPGNYHAEDDLESLKYTGRCRLCNAARLHRLVEDMPQE